MLVAPIRKRTAHRKLYIVNCGDEYRSPRVKAPELSTLQVCDEVLELARAVASDSRLADVSSLFLTERNFSQRQSWSAHLGPLRRTEHAF